jgi:hypothetical protein
MGPEFRKSMTFGGRRAMPLELISPDSRTCAIRMKINLNNGISIEKLNLKAADGIRTHELLITNQPL